MLSKTVLKIHHDLKVRYFPKLCINVVVIVTARNKSLKQKFTRCWLLIHNRTFSMETWEVDVYQRVTGSKYTRSLYSKKC